MEWKRNLTAVATALALASPVWAADEREGLHEGPWDTSNWEGPLYDQLWDRNPLPLEYAEFAAVELEESPAPGYPEIFSNFEGPLYDRAYERPPHEVQGRYPWQNLFD